MRGATEHIDHANHDPGDHGGGTATSLAAPDFDSIYAEARGDIAAVPWADGCPCQCLINWLNVLGPAMIRPGGRVAVVGCGLGDDAAALAARGYDVVAFDASATAVQWAKRRFPHIRDSFIQADLFNVPSRLKHRFDFVAEAYTIQSLDPARRDDAARAIASLAASHGVILAVADARPAEQPVDEVAGPPWPLTAAELQGAFREAGWFPSGSIAEFDDDEHPPVRRLRAAFIHG
jgi:SAM-dependent methyltransferase